MTPLSPDTTQSTAPRHHFAAAIVFLAVTVLAASEFLEVIPQFAPVVASPWFPFFHESHDLLSLMVVLYAAHKLSPAVAMWAVAWFLALHIPYAWLQFPEELPELARLALLAVAALFGVRIITQRRQAKEQAVEAGRRQREVMATLLELTQVVGSSLEIKGVLKVIARRTAEACRANRCAIFLLDDAGEMLLPVMSQFADGHVDPEQWQAFKETTADRLDEVPLFRQAVRQRRAVLLDDAARTDLLPAKWTQPFDIQKLLAVPLVSRDEAIGLMALDQTHVSHEFTPAQIDLALAIGGQAAGGIVNARLYAESERRAEQVQALRSAGLALASDLRLESTLRTLTEIAQGLTDARYAALLVLDEDDQPADFHTAGLSEEERQRIGEPPRGHGLLGALLREAAPIRVADIACDPRATGFPPHHPPMKTFMGVPIMARGKMIGGLYLTEKAGAQQFTLEDENLVVGLAADAAIAIENARLFEQVQRQAITDGLTGLYNRRQFFDLAGREFERTQRYARPLSAIMLDIDHFKKVNDTHGHAVGDQMLQELAARFRANLRDIDVLARYGGEEFAVLLPESELPAARQAAERLRQAVAETPFETAAGPLAITISLGVAALTEDCPTLAALLDGADAAMYAAKDAGRNGVCVHSSSF